LLSYLATGIDKTSDNNEAFLGCTISNFVIVIAEVDSVTAAVVVVKFAQGHTIRQLDKNSI